MLEALYDIVQTRKAHMPEGSYTAYLLQAGEDEILKKIGEESVEVILAAKGQGDQRVIEEVSDLFYHVLVLLAGKGISFTDIEEELRKRHATGDLGNTAE